MHRLTGCAGLSVIPETSSDILNTFVVFDAWEQASKDSHESYITLPGWALVNLPGFRYRSCDVSLRKAVLGSAAAPTYLPPMRVQLNDVTGRENGQSLSASPEGSRPGGSPSSTTHAEPSGASEGAAAAQQVVLTCIDGGVAANNPAQAALAFASTVSDASAMLSLGTGKGNVKCTCRAWMVEGPSSARVCCAHHTTSFVPPGVTL